MHLHRYLDINCVRRILDMNNIHCTLYTIQCTLYNVYCTTICILPMNSRLTNLHYSFPGSYSIAAVFAYRPLRPLGEQAQRWSSVAGVVAGSEAGVVVVHEAGVETALHATIVHGFRHTSQL